MGFEHEIKPAAASLSAAGTGASGETVDRVFLPAMIGAAPVLLMLLSWAPGGVMTLSQAAIRASSLPIIAVELLVVMLALRRGLFSAIRTVSWPRIVPIAAAVLLAIMLATAAFAPVPGRAGVATGFWVLHALFGLSVWQLSGRLLRGEDLVHAYLAGFVLFVACFALFVSQVPDPARFDWTRGLPAGTHIRHLGYYAAAIFGLSAGVMAGDRGRLSWAAAFGVAALAAAFAFWTGSRGTIAAAIAGLLAGIVLLPAARRLRCWAGALGAIALGALAASALPSPAGNMGLERTMVATAGDNIATGRFEMWRIVVEAIRERPLFGYGEAQMAEVARFWDMIQPHNIVLQTTLAWGMIGSLCIALLVVAYARQAIPAVRSEAGETLAPFLAMMTLAAFSLFDGALFYALPISIFMACGGLVACRWRRDGAQA